MPKKTPTSAATQPSSQPINSNVGEAANERTYWESIRDSKDPEDFRAYLSRYPGGMYKELARIRLNNLEAEREAARKEEAKRKEKTEKKLAASTIWQNPMGMELVWIAPGNFMMGSETVSSDEKPVHQVMIGNGFYMGKYEVTIAEWRKVMGNIPEGMKKDLGRKFKDDERKPVLRVSWDDAREFIRKLNALGDGYTYRLPTEAEWEYACRAGTTGDYAGNLDAMAWYSLNSGQQTHPVGQRQPNGFGLYDMHGNVWEWCEDLYHENYNGAPTDGSAWLSGGEQEYRVLRGGSWKYSARDLRSAYRRKSEHSYFSENTGFRIVAVART
jgi:formylglycine-generating enzyme required for sulfatase activity